MEEKIRIRKVGMRRKAKGKVLKQKAGSWQTETEEKKIKTTPKRMK